jgi:hypothetical protein
VKSVIRRGVAWNFVFVALAAGCATGPPSPGESVDDVAATSLTVEGASSDSVAAEGDAFEDRAVAATAELSPADAAVLVQASTILVGRCLLRLGFDVTLPPTSRPASPPPNRYPTADEVEMFGYGWVGDEDLLEPVSLPPEVEAARDEVCGPEAAEAVGYRRYSEVSSVVELAATDAANKAVADPAVVAMLDGWSDCMTAAGLDFPYPRAARAEAKSAGFRSTTGLAIARADYACRRSVGYLETLTATRNKYWDAWVEAHPQAIADRRAARDELIDRALSVIENQ